MIEKLKKIALEAGKAILEVYEKEIIVESKIDEMGFESPLTEADTKADDIISYQLEKHFPKIPFISEENYKIPYEKRKKWKEFFLVDPLDGTKEFVKKGRDFTVNIAYVKGEKVFAGVVYVPVTNDMYSSDGKKSYKNGKQIRAKESGEVLKIIASKSHFSEETEHYINKLGREYELVNVGSSLKLCLIATGEADLYPRLGPTMEWDTAAAHAIVKTAGANVLNYETGKEITYNKEELHNPWFIVVKN